MKFTQLIAAALIASTQAIHISALGDPTDPAGAATRPNAGPPANHGIPYKAPVAHLEATADAAAETASEKWVASMPASIQDGGVPVYPPVAKK